MSLPPVPAGESERAFLLYLGHAQSDDREGVLASCRHCHNARGIQSVNSFQAPYRRTPADWFPTTRDQEIDAVTRWKRQQYAWGLFDGMKD